MARYILLRLVGITFVLLAVSLITFFLMRSVPGGPFDENNQPLSTAAKANILKKFGLDQPWYVQWWKYVSSAAQGDFGYSYKNPSKSIVDILTTAWGPSLILGGLTLLWSVPLGLVLGVVAAVKRNTWIDTVITPLAIFGTTLPIFALDLFGLYLFALVLKWVPYPAASAGWRPDQDLRILILPVVIFGLQPLGVVARYTRSNLLEVLSQDYVRTARAKGLAFNVVLFRHALRNSLIPIVTVLGPLIPNALTGSAILERQFLIPGIGRYFIESVLQRDYPLIMATVLVVAVLWGFSYLLSDIAYTFVDPRIRIGGLK